MCLRGQRKVRHSAEQEADREKSLMWQRREIRRVGKRCMSDPEKIQKEWGEMMTAITFSHCLISVCVCVHTYRRVWVCGRVGCVCVGGGVNGFPGQPLTCHWLISWNSEQSEGCDLTAAWALSLAFTFYNAALFCCRCLFLCFSLFLLLMINLIYSINVVF